jgi:hypothetical protein
MRLNIYLIIMAALCMASLSSGKIIYVDDDATGANNGSSWENAYTFLQDGLSYAQYSEKPIEIHVAQGTYKPNQGAKVSQFTFQLINGVALIGGYAGHSGSNPNSRDIERYKTILSGDLAGNDIDVNNPIELANETTRSDNVRVVSGSSTDETAVLDGFIITGGRSYSVGIDNINGGGGMYNYSGSPTINNCTFTDNSTNQAGGGMLNLDGSNPILTNCKFIKNYSSNGGGVFNGNSSPIFIDCAFTDNYARFDGAGMEAYTDIWIDGTHTGMCTLIDCIFENNSVYDYGNGGGLNIHFFEAILTDCVFIGNSALLGGGIYNNSGSLKINNCQFSKNYGRYNGGGLASSDDANSKITSCIFIGNSTRGSGGGLAGFNSIYNSIISGNVAIQNGGGIWGWGETTNCTIIGNKAHLNGGGIFTQGITTLTNSIVRNNRALSGNELYVGLRSMGGGRFMPIIVTSELTVTYSNIQGLDEKIPVDSNCTLIWKTGNSNTDAYFIDPGYWDPNSTTSNITDDFWVKGDYHLKSQAGRLDPNTQSWIQDDVTSPCIDVGDPMSPIGLEPFPNGGRINMGSYGGTIEASKSYFGEPLCQTIIAGDINGDCKVDLTDLEILLLHWLEDGTKTNP